MVRPEKLQGRLKGLAAGLLRLVEMASLKFDQGHVGGRQNSVRMLGAQILPLQNQRLLQELERLIGQTQAPVGRRIGKQQIGPDILVLNRLKSRFEGIQELENR